MCKAWKLTRDSGWLQFWLGDVCVKYPQSLDNGADDRIEVVYGNQRCFIEVVDGQLDVSKIEIIAK
jgi:hypothetical protein